MYVLRLQTCIVWFLSLFSEWLTCMRQNFKLLYCAAYILNLIVSICLSCWPNLWCSGVFSAEFRSFRKNSAKPDISRKCGSASRIFFKNPAEGSMWVGSINKQTLHINLQLEINERKMYKVGYGKKTESDGAVCTLDRRKRATSSLVRCRQITQQ